MARPTRGQGSLYKPSYRDKKTGERKVSAVWWMKYYVNGLPVRESTDTTNDRDANARLNDKLGKAERGEAVLGAKHVTLDRLVDLLKDNYRTDGNRSWRRAEQAVAHLTGFFGAQAKALAIVPARITRYVTTREDEGAKPATVRYELAVLRRAFRVAVKEELLAHVPYIRKIEVKNTRVGFFTDAEFAAVLAGLPAETQPLVEFLWWTGWRVGPRPRLVPGRFQSRRRAAGTRHHEER
jgi:hypothetical protein